MTIIQGILIGLMILIGISAGIFSWWLDNGKPKEDESAPKKDPKKEN